MELTYEFKHSVFKFYKLTDHDTYNICRLLRILAVLLGINYLFFRGALALVDFHTLGQTGDEWARGRSGAFEITEILFRNSP